ncbi:ribonuclease R [Acidocella aminolytica]|uniref:Ribonuclease R n=1 Tax=Acidocella aminolytica 101 = DSM 11237 TaxID=1120923 RepID=A0A0D6PCJ7_9PROT|nr:ribonuclease R [Acidocella aminolytica]GAN79377.1 ribonuclease R [Acidocella aminolytica 101 = DSM 11237]GBQ39362.1 ribonuclease R [Acidocella aminolytica 101 = DSM 11237]SHE39703.1 RNAse R [Acidocella aminolytica 101 = DSM 11237]
MKTRHKQTKPKPLKPAKEARRATLPTRDAVKRFLSEAEGVPHFRDVVRAFSVAPEDRKALRGIMKSLEVDGHAERAGRRRYVEAGRLPENVMVEVTGIDRDGEAIARPVTWDAVGKPPVIFMQPERKGAAALAPGARVLARLRRIGPDKYEGRTIKRVEGQSGSIVGLFHKTPHGGRIESTNRRQKGEWIIPASETMDAEEGEIVRAEPLPGKPFGPKPARITERLGNANDARSVSLIAIAQHGIPMDFPEAALKEAKRARNVALGKRTDLRDLPLITIDGADARDFDDAVFAAPEPHGYRLIVAIADVAHYVKPRSALDIEARLRGNSCYFPDRVVPMLPEALSNGLCSLKPDEERGCLFVEIHIDVHGTKLNHKFGRGLMRSAARKTYDEVQAEFEDNPENHGHLFAAFHALSEARKRRGTLDLDLPERKVTLDAAGQVQNIAPRPRLDAHKLIEEFMILANVCAAEELERLKLPCMYRVHAPPSPEKLDNLRSFLATLDISLKPGDQLHPRDLDGILKLVEGTPSATMVNETMLRAQSQAEYAPDNIGHFGLALTRYAHFTSPIRRYADLLVHRALIKGLKLGRDGLTDEEIAAFADTAEQITATERRATLAERDSIDRYLALYLQHRVGELFHARISGVTKFGLFATLTESGASGFLSMASLPDDAWVYDERAQTLSGRRSRVVFSLTQEIEVRLNEAKPITGGLLFGLTGMPETQAVQRRTGNRMKPVRQAKAQQKKRR